MNGGRFQPQGCLVFVGRFICHGWASLKTVLGRGLPVGRWWLPWAPGVVWMMFFKQGQVFLWKCLDGFGECTKCSFWEWMHNGFSVGYVCLWYVNMMLRCSPKQSKAKLLLSSWTNFCDLIKMPRQKVNAVLGWDARAVGWIGKARSSWEFFSWQGFEMQNKVEVGNWVKVFVACSCLLVHNAEWNVQGKAG